MKERDTMCLCVFFACVAWISWKVDFRWISPYILYYVRDKLIKVYTFYFYTSLAMHFVFRANSKPYAEKRASERKTDWQTDSNQTTDKSNWREWREAARIYQKYKDVDKAVSTLDTYIYIYPVHNVILHFL